LPPNSEQGEFSLHRKASWANDLFKSKVPCLHWFLFENVACRLRVGKVDLGICQYGNVIESYGLQSLRKGLVMANDDEVYVDRYGASVPGTTLVNNGASIPMIQSISGQRGGSTPIQVIAPPVQQSQASQESQADVSVVSSNQGK
jgi:hypothetical protein